VSIFLGRDILGTTSLGSKLVSFNQTLVNTFRVTHSTNEDLLNIKCKDDAKSRILSRTSDTTETLEPVCNKSHFVSLF
jgi:hypothetical protein